MFPAAAAMAAPNRGRVLWLMSAPAAAESSIAPAHGWPYPRLTRATLLDGEGTTSLREALGALLGHCESASMAVSRIRLAALDLAPGDLARVARCRVLVGRLDAETAALPRTGDAREGARASLSLLQEFLRSGRVEVRSAGVDAWYPDFSVFQGLRTGPGRPSTAAVLLGGHAFGHAPAEGTFLTSLVIGADAGARATGHFERLWGSGYDVLPVVADMLERLRESLEREEVRPISRLSAPTVTPANPVDGAVYLR